MSDAIDDAVDKAEVETFPQAFARKICDRIDDVAVVKFVEPPFLLKYLRHFAERLLSECEPADRDTKQPQGRPRDRQASAPCCMTSGSCDFAASRAAIAVGIVVSAITGSRVCSKTFASFIPTSELIAYGTPISPPTVERNARMISGTVITQGDSCGLKFGGSA